mmetsp:Transcript_118456/g.166539  ORF Transcript_118456/g.166539 Transcript_118456/m.166539 type:complete len:393 (+) Transcript_118456:60-1238(+)|eukprot:s417_g3.t1
MGCCASSTASEVPVPKPRRRLSVGQVDESELPGHEDSQAEQDRGLIAAFSKNNLIEMVSETDQTPKAKSGRRVSLSSKTDKGTTSFANKTMQKFGDTDVDIAQCGIGYTCRKGLKPESPNQDSWFVLKMENFSLYGVFDGHGQKGHDVSNFAMDMLPKCIIKDERVYSTEKRDWGPILSDAFKKTQNFITQSDKMKTLQAQMSGTTATVAIHDHSDNSVTIGHVADSTAALGTKNVNAWSGVALTRDHKPNLKDEKARIEKAGGRVVFDGYANYRVYAKNARYPGLNMSRCLGDLLGHAECGMSCEPEVNKIAFEKGKQYILLVCSDGVWEFISAQEAVDIVSKYDANEATAAADDLAKEAWDRWIKEEGGSVVDDITVVLLYVGFPPVKQA